MRKIFVIVLTVLALSSPLRAQPLVDRVPDDAVIYLGWRGYDAMKKDLNGTHLQGLLDSTKLPEMITSGLAQLSQFTIEQDDAGRQAREGLELLSSLGATTWSSPFALYISPPAAGAKPEGAPRLIMTWQAGDKAQALLDKITPALKRQHGADAPKAIRVDSFVVLYAGSATEADARAAKPPAALAANAAFKSALAQARPNAAAVAYVNGEAILAWIDREHATTRDQGFKDNWPKMRDSLGLAGFKRLIWSAGVDGKDWATQTFVEAPAPRKGLLKLLDTQPLSPDAVKLVPKEATWFAASRFDLGALVENVRAGVVEAEPAAKEQIDQAVNMANGMTGLDVPKFLNSFGPEWVAYTEPSAMGPNAVGMVMVNPLRDAAAVELGLSRIEAIVNQQLSMNAEPNAPQIGFRTVEQSGVKIHTVNVIFVSPSWAVHEKKLYVGLYPQTVVTAASIRPKQPGSILDNASYAAVRARLGAKDPAAVTFCDLPSTAPGTYPLLVILSQLGSVNARQANGSPAPALLMPPLSAILPHVAPSAGASWSDDKGFYSRSLAPFPGSNLLGPQGSQISASQGAMLVGVMLPALGAARRTSQQMQAMTQLRGIHQGMILYSMGNDEKYPKHMGQLLDGNYFTPEYAMSPFLGRPQLPDGFNEMSSEEKGDWLANNGSFVILRWNVKGETDSTKVVGYLRPSHSNGQGTGVVFDDNSTRWMSIAEATQLIKSQYPDHEIDGGHGAAPAAPR